MKKNVVIGFVGTTYDAGYHDKRWERWRPTVGLCAQESFRVDRLELFICKESEQKLVDQLRADIAKVSPHTEVVSHLLCLNNPFDLSESYTVLYDFCRQYKFDVEKEDYFAHWTTGTGWCRLSWFTLCESRHFPGKLAESAPMKEVEPVWRGHVKLIDLNLSIYDAIAARFAKEAVESEVILKGGIVTNDPGFNAKISRIEKVCLNSDSPMMFIGPTGAGKSVLTRRVYNLLKARHLVEGPFVSVNCATLQGDNAQSTLFGHKKGAFTGAQTDRQGLLKAADGGLLFLDEIGTLPLEEQAKVLTALERKAFYPLGSDKEVTSNFRIIVGTNVDLRKAVAAGTFREDLYARLNTWVFSLPGLAERRADIEPNLEHELDRVSAEKNLRVSFNAAARAKYLEFAMAAPWPGNFRDLAASVSRMATLAEGGRIREDDVDLELEMLRETWGSGTVYGEDAPLVPMLLPHLRLDLFEEVQLECALRAIKSTHSAAEAYRKLFSVSVEEKKNQNPSHRIRTTLARWGLEYKDIKHRLDLLG